jgi:hypothetical protein
MEQRALVTQPRKLLLGKFMIVDPFMLFAWSAPVVLLGLLLITTIFGRYRSMNSETAWQWFGGGTLISVCVFTPIALWRFYQINNVLQQGVVVDGEITGLSFNKYFGRVIWQYEFQNQSYKGASFITNTDITRDLEIGEVLTVIVHPHHPQRSVIRYLYCKTENEEEPDTQG